MEQQETPDSVMFDIESAATGPNAGLLQIGARAFSMTTGRRFGDAFHVDVDLLSSLMLGGEVDNSTLIWWRARGGFKPVAQPNAILNALTKFSAWFKKFPTVSRTWANGPSFDIAVMEGYYRRAGLATPWAYNAARDLRTVLDLAKEHGWVKPKQDIAHDGLADSEQQIDLLVSALAAIPRPGVLDEITVLREELGTARRAGFDSVADLLAAYNELQGRTA